MLPGDFYDQFRVSPLDPTTLRAADVERCLQTLAESSGGKLIVEKLAESFERRPIYLAKIGSGPRRVFMWTQMHGDEPTHTAVVLDLISFLLTSPADRHAAKIISGCTLWIMPMVNPDGAEHGTRTNAQHVDVNRDAWRQATPEGRALKQAAEACQPQFAFSLHSQNARTSVGNPPQPAAVAVMATPVDAANTVTAEVRIAKQIAACFVIGVRQRMDGIVARYVTEYMPQAFGEAIQSLGAATLLVEAGGWPEADPTPMVELHFRGLVAALEAIATDRYRDIHTDSYDMLPGPNEQKLLDCVIKNALVVDPADGAQFRVDLGINYSNGQRLNFAPSPDGKVVDIGDSSVTAGKLTIQAHGYLAMPGRIAFVEDLMPGGALPSNMVDDLLAAGVTTAMSVVDIEDQDALRALASQPNWPINCGFVVRLDRTSRPTEKVLEHVVFAVSRGLLAAVGNEVNPRIREYLAWFNVPVLPTGQLPSAQLAAASYADLAREIWRMHTLLGLGGSRGRIRREHFADLQLFELSDSPGATTAVDLRKLRRVMVAGVTVWENGRRTGANPGQFLRRLEIKPKGR